MIGMRAQAIAEIMDGVLQGDSELVINGEFIFDSRQATTGSIFIALAEHNRELLEADWTELERPLFWGLSRKSFLEATKIEKRMKDRDEALDFWNRELLARRQPMVLRVS